MDKTAKIVASVRHSSCYVGAGLLALGCIALFVGPAQGQTLAPDATGTVTCEQVDNYGTVGTVTYNVGYYVLTHTVSNRWNDGLDFVYRPGHAFGQTSKRFSSYTVYLHQEYIDTVNYESFFSETGQLTIRVGKNNAMSVTGKSFVVMDMSASPFSGECVWNLTGIYPTG